MVAFSLIWNFDHVSAYFMHWIALCIYGRDCHIVRCLYKLCILSVGDCFTDLSINVAFVCKNCVTLAKFQHIDGSARWLTSFNFNHTLHAGTLPSAGHCWPTVQLLLCFSCVPEEKTFLVHRSCCHQKLTNTIKPLIL